MLLVSTLLLAATVGGNVESRAARFFFRGLLATHRPCFPRPIPASGIVFWFFFRSSPGRLPAPDPRHRLSLTRHVTDPCKQSRQPPMKPAAVGDRL